MLASKQSIGAASNSTRGIICSGSDANPAVNVIMFVTMTTTGNAIDFGDLSIAKSNTKCAQSPTRSVNIGGATGTGSNTDNIDFITIASQGNAADFGNLVGTTRQSHAVCSNAVRGVINGGSPSTNAIEFITIATLGDSTDFGDLTRASANQGAASSPTRATVFGGGSSNQIEYYQIMTTGNAADFGDLTQSISETAGCSNGHGGL